MFRLKWLVVMVGALLLSSCAWFPSVKEPPYQLVKTWGGKGGTPGLFNEPTGVAVSKSEVFVSDSRNGRIQVFDLDGNFQRLLGDAGTGKLERPMNLVVANGELYVADYFNDVIQVYTRQGQFVRAIGKPGAGPGEFNAPGGVAVASNGDLFIADFYNQRIQQLDAKGGFIRQWGTSGETGVWAGEFNYPTDVAIAPDGTRYVADGYNDRVQVFSPNGDFSHKWGGPLAMNIFGSFNGWFATVTGLSVGPQGNIFVADFYNDRVQKFTPEGKFLNAFGIPAQGPTHTAIAVAVTEDGTVFVADYANHQIQKWQPSE
ncbi:MAG: 6-bladed beta-propeller [Gammaproteobacteria bacterium]|nr:6-bladed beta-propeller [Gammaproteobacteria bacterium]